MHIAFVCLLKCSRHPLTCSCTRLKAQIMHSLPDLRIGLHFEGGLGQFYTFLINNTEMLDFYNTAPVKRIETCEHKMQISPRNNMRSSKWYKSYTNIRTQFPKGQIHITWLFCPCVVLPMSCTIQNPSIQEAICKWLTSCWFKFTMRKWVCARVWVCVCVCVCTSVRTSRYSHNSSHQSHPPPLSPSPTPDHFSTDTTGLPPNAQVVGTYGLSHIFNYLQGRVTDLIIMHSQGCWW